ncbi:MAG TPA: hypothetical protein VJ440_00815 [Candidatus Brocadiaceae bacterium]|nr:hypothetical protein [Candidatus Brocadiaceae bacterium]
MFFDICRYEPTPVGDRRLHTVVNGPFAVKHHRVFPSPSGDGSYRYEPTPVGDRRMLTVVHCHSPLNTIGYSHRRQETAPTHTRGNVCHPPVRANSCWRPALAHRRALPIRRQTPSGIPIADGSRLLPFGCF